MRRIVALIFGVRFRADKSGRRWRVFIEGARVHRALFSLMRVVFNLSGANF
jgi:hypothetical protein